MSLHVPDSVAHGGQVGERQQRLVVHEAGAVWVQQLHQRSHHLHRSLAGERDLGVRRDGDFGDCLRSVGFTVVVVVLQSQRHQRLWWNSVRNSSIYIVHVQNVHA